ncbi:MAG: septal ring lytic transglycosylase RlpA family protein [Proteobacteria bacterium]|nr:septal ring lytic transglycosylase RlpA family protein [Pseudomonadota bacterium]
MFKNISIILLVTLIVSNCAQKPNKPKQEQEQKPITNAGRYAIAQDHAPNATDFDISTLEPWVIQSEEKSRYGNHSPYMVFGTTYYLAHSVAEDFEQTGTASWYGKKFHGHSTSNMEVFDMDKLTAAHRTLPLPSYVEVTNLSNNKKVVVRVNDRGPFAGKRIIDLSWAAAKVLEFDKQGLADVHIRLLEAPDNHSKPKKNQEIKHAVEYKTNPNLTGLKYLQIGAFAEKERALQVAAQISKLVLLPVHISNTIHTQPLFRVRIGPLSENENIVDLIQHINQKGYSDTKMVVEKTF